MIKNDRQLNRTKQQLAELEEHLEHLKRRYPDPDEYDFYSEATRDQMDGMRREMRDYQTARRSAIDPLLRIWTKRGAVSPTRKDQISLGEFIALLRIARGLTQEQLARKLRLRQSHIARFEQRAYRNFTVETLNRVFDELGVKLSLQPARHREAG